MPMLWVPSHVVADITLPGNATNIDVANLDYNNDGPWRLYLATHNPTGAGNTTYLYFNADYVNANYENQWLRASGVAMASGRAATPEIGHQIAGTSSILIGTIMVDAAGYARYRGNNCRRVAVALQTMSFGMCTDSPVANITSLRIGASVANAQGTGTRLILTRIAH